LRAGTVDEDGRRTKTTVGTPQGATISPLLANVYLHYGAPQSTEQHLRWDGKELIMT
jgi:retron-type reverse transcriptase